MSLRVRLVGALAALLVIGLAAFGVGTYLRYARSEYAQLDQRLQNLAPALSHQLADKAGITDGGPGAGARNGGGSGRDNQPSVAPEGTYGELRSPTGTVLQSVKPYNDSAPKLPATIVSGRIFTVGSSTGSGTWRVYASTGPDNAGYQTVVAVPTGDVADSLRQLAVTETIAGLVLLLALSGGSWLVLRRGLRPLENMAVSARSINAGDLSQRVSPADGRGEVGQLGLALNSMLGEIETAFEQRAETEQKLRQFLADASHELRTPLTSIRGFAELFRLGTDNDHVDQGVIMRRIEEESTRMKVLVDDLLLLARLDQTRPVEFAPIDLAVLAADACSDAVAGDPGRPVTLDAPDPVVIAGVRDHLRQALANLVANALRHTPSGTPLDVSAQLVGAAAVIRVRDHGKGLDDEALAHAFDRFWQADKARVGKGAGLGLSIVAGIAREHGGTVEAGNADGGGACFTIHLPLQAPLSAGSGAAVDEAAAPV